MIFRLYRENFQIAATSTSTAGTMVAGKISPRCFKEDEESTEEDTELVAEGTAKDVGAVA
jgi:hypothetical protein